MGIYNFTKNVEGVMYLYNNPNKSITPIKVHKKEIKCYSPKDVEKLIEVLQKEPIKYQAVILLALDSGCRRGEITGLTWNDIDLKNKEFICILEICSACNLG